MPNDRDRITIPALVERKGKEPIVMVTAYDAPTARLLDEAGVEVLLVGDSLGMVVLGRETTLDVTMDEMVHHTQAVVRGRRRALVVADMPYLSYHVSREEAVRNAGRFVQAGAAGVKIEGGARRADLVRALLDAEVPVMGHIGLTPQSYHRMGGFRVQGRGEREAQALVEDARALERAGVWSIVLEGIPAGLGRRITEEVGVPTIGIGAGPGCDGQVLVVHDLLGLGGPATPRFVRRYAELGKEIVHAVSSFVSDVKSRSFPSEAESYPDPAGPGRPS
jgi:3-methyl-2-oxobutanoate hydroxymethyltransferase